MKMIFVIQFLFPKAICIESAAKFRDLQIARLKKAGVILNQDTIEDQTEDISGIRTDFMPIVSPFSLAL